MSNKKSYRRCSPEFKREAIKRVNHDTHFLDLLEENLRLRSLKNQLLYLLSYASET
jgi:hypothetical protein